MNTNSVSSTWSWSGNTCAMSERQQRGCKPKQERMHDCAESDIMECSLDNLGIGWNVLYLDFVIRRDIPLYIVDPSAPHLQIRWSSPNPAYYSTKKLTMPGG